jgi:hypothetical protein
MPTCINGVVIDIAKIERIARQGSLRPPNPPEKLLTARESEPLTGLGLGGGF